MIIGFYLDDDSSDHAIIPSLIRQDLTIVTTRSAGRRGEPDIVHLRFAASQGLCLVTSNQGDFQRLHGEFAARGEGHSGIVVVTQQRWGPGERVRRLLRIAAAFSPAEMENRIEFLSDWGDDRETSPPVRLV